MKLLNLAPWCDEAIIMAMGPSRKKLTVKFREGRALAVVNRAGYEWPGYVHYWVTYHAELMERWWFKRESMGHKMDDIRIITTNKAVKLPEDLPVSIITAQVRGLNCGGTSSILAALAMLDIGYKRIHLFGVDLDGPMWSKERKFWSILKDKPLVFHGDDWFHRGDFREVEK